MSVQLLHGDCRDVLRTLADGSPPGGTIDERNLPMARDRIHGDSPLFAEVAA